MSVDERLARWERPMPDVDADALLSRVHRTVRRRRQRRVVVGSAAVMVLFVGALLASMGGGDDTEVDAVGPGQPAPVRYLPRWVPAGFELAWVDEREERVAPPTEPERWDTGAGSAYVYGYRSDDAELDIDVFPGYTLDTAAVARDWDGDVQVMSDEAGRGAVLMGSDRFQLAAFEIDGAVLQVLSHGLGEADPTVGFGVLDAFTRSFREVDERTWRAAIATVDSAPPYGERGAGDALLGGEHWQLVRVPYRTPRSTTRDALVLRAGGTTAPDVFFADEPAIHGEDIRLELFPADDGTIAWGIAAPEAAIIRLWFAEGAIETDTVPFGNNTAFAVDFGDLTGPLRELTVWDAAGQRLYAGANPGRITTCVDDGDRTTTVPDVIGMGLRDAIATVEDAGMTVIGSGAPPEDPLHDATIVAQEPPAGTTVPVGACIGFRTE